jgi:RNA polymerase sigma-70 factor (ECF subfamily)
VAQLTRFCVKLTGDQEAARDVVQETFVQVWAARERYAPRGRFRVFLLKIAHNRVRNHRRSAHRTERRETAVRLAAVVHDEPEPEQLEVLLRQERRRRIHAALGRLPYKMREALLLRFDQEMDYPEIAAVVGRPEATIRTRVFHGLRRLRTMLDGELLR